jgi:mono/diheme cytochrome c family protein
VGRDVMRQFLFGSAAAALAMTMSVPAFAETETIKGRIVDQGCYLKDPANNVGKDHKMPADTTDCAITCAQKGNTMALLTADGKLYAIAGGLAADKNAKLVPHIGRTVEIAGDVMKMDGKMMIHADALKGGSTTVPQDAKVAKGEQVFTEQKCSLCHSIGGHGNAKGLLDAVATKLSADELRAWITDAKEMTAKTNAPRKPAMKQFALPKDDVDALVAYLQTMKGK